MNLTESESRLVDLMAMLRTGGLAAEFNDLYEDTIFSLGADRAYDLWWAAVSQATDWRLYELEER